MGGSARSLMAVVRACVAAAALASIVACTTPPAPPTTEPRSLSVAADQGWQDSGVVIAAGKPFALRDVRGEIHDQDEKLTNGAGTGYTCGRPDCCEPMPMVRRSALVAKVGDEIFAVNDGGTFTTRTGGALHLRINDCDSGLYDNGGTLEVDFAP